MKTLAVALVMGGLAGDRAPDYETDGEDPVVVDLDATLVTSHSENEQARENLQEGFRVPSAWVDHGPDGTGESRSMIQRPGNAGANTAADHIAVTKQAFGQLPAFLDWLTEKRVQYSIGFGLTETLAQLRDTVPEKAWTPAYDADRQPRDGARVVDHRLRRQPADRVRHQHRGWAAGRPRTSSPPPSPSQRKREVPAAKTASTPPKMWA